MQLTLLRPTVVPGPRRTCHDARTRHVAARGVVPAGAADTQQLRRQLADALAPLAGISGVLPGGNEQAKARVVELAAALERAAPFDPGAPGAAAALLGDWSLVFASSGTVVTRSAPAQLLAALSALPGVGISRIRQELAPAGGADPSQGAGVSCSNAMTLGLGLASLGVRIRGSWLPAQAGGELGSGSSSSASGGNSRGSGSGGSSDGGGGGGGGPGLASEVAFDGFGVQLTGLLGLDLQLPELTLRVPRRAPRGTPNWRTTYCDGEYRVGRGVDSGGVFLFRKEGAA